MFREQYVSPLARALAVYVAAKNEATKCKRAYLDASFETDDEPLRVRWCYAVEAADMARSQLDFEKQHAGLTAKG